MGSRLGSRLWTPVSVATAPACWSLLEAHRHAGECLVRLAVSLDAAWGQAKGDVVRSTQVLG